MFDLPLHPLLVHATVIVVPLSALCVAIAQWWPAARARMGWVPLVAAAVAAALGVLTVGAGLALADSVGPLPAVLEHRKYGLAVCWLSLGILAAALVQGLWFRLGRTRRPALRRGENAQHGGNTLPDGPVTTGVDPTVRHPSVASRVLAMTLGVATTVIALACIAAVVLAGESGARAVWSGIS